MSGTIYIVDDDKDFLEMEKSILLSQGYTVAGFSDPRTALAALREHAQGGQKGDPPGLLITDLMMNQLDAGFTLARAVKSEPGLAGLRVIIVSAVSSQKGFDFRPQGAADLEAMGADAFFDKPVTPDAFLGKVKDLVR
jgi:CheY-like chemotaxis protein